MHFHALPSKGPAIQLSWPLRFSIGLLAAVSAVIGHNIYICNSVFGGAAFTLVLPLIFIFAPGSFIGFLVITALVGATAPALLSAQIFAKRLWLRFVAVSLASLLLANWLSYALQSPLVCSVGRWN